MSLSFFDMMNFHVFVVAVHFEEQDSKFPSLRNIKKLKLIYTFCGFFLSAASRLKPLRSAFARILVKRSKGFSKTTFPFWQSSFLTDFK